MTDIAKCFMVVLNLDTTISALLSARQTSFIGTLFFYFIAAFFTAIVRITQQTPIVFDANIRFSVYILTLSALELLIKTTFAVNLDIFISL